MNRETFATRRPLRPLAWLLLLAGTVAITACRADFDVTVTVEEDGSGIVETVTTLDAEASEQLLDLDLDAAGLPLADLAQSGWNVGRPERQPDGSTVVTASKRFGTTAQFSEVMSELTGDDGVLSNFRLFRTKTFARVDYRLVGMVNTTDGLDSFGDSDLVRALGDRPVSEIAEGYGASVDDVTFTIDVVLPGSLQGEAPLQVIETEASETGATWVVPLSEPEVTSIELRSATREVAPLVLRGVAIVAGVLAGLVVFAQLLRIVFPDRRRRTHQRAGRRSTTGRPSPKETAEAEPATDASAEGVSEPETDVVEPHRVVALDGLGVLYRRGGTVATVLIPFARERASRVADEDIAAKARQLQLGRITTGQFWSSIGVDGDPDALDAEYLAQLQLTPGVIKYLRSLRDRGIRAACIANEATEWAARLRGSHSLDSLIDPWVISGAVGVRKPDKPIFEVLRRVTGEPPGAILVVDDDLNVLDAARDLGYATSWFSAEGTREQARGHPVIRSFDGVPDELAEAEASS